MDKLLGLKSKLAILQAIGVGPIWVRRQLVMDTVESAPLSIVEKKENKDNKTTIDTMDWAQLEATVSACRKCDLCHNRKQTVFGVGDKQAKWLFIGEGPGRQEDKQGEPFVGLAGQLLDNILLAMGLARGKNVYIANIVKCRPSDNNGRDRPPTAQEVAACLAYLQRQIALIKPTILIALGKTAALSLLDLDPATSVSRLRGKVYYYQGLPLIVTYHPAYLLRQLGDKRKSWDDLCLALDACPQ